MIPLTLAEIARVVDGTVYRTAGTGITGTGITVTGPAVIDSREVTAGVLFAAIAGAHSDGHDFAAAAYSGGAVAVLGSRPVDGPCVLVDDVVTALAKLAGLVRDRLSPVVIGLTGSVGKTTTKDLLAQILEREAPTIATSRSFNNELGLPLTILRADQRTRYLVLEMGAAKPGDITHLVRVGRPQIGMVLNVGPAHVLTMGGIDGVVKTKAEMVRDLPTAAEGGLALLNADDERVAAMARQTQAAVTFYGTGQDAEVRAGNVTLDAAARASFTLRTRAGQAPVRLRLPGEHQVANALAAACAAAAVGVPADRIAVALSSAVPRSPGRFEIKERADGVTVIDDAYNANPASTGAAIRTLATMAAGRRTVAVLGEMMHQAEGTIHHHRAIGALAGVLGIDVLVAVGNGEGPDALVAAAREAGVSVHAVPDGETAIDLLRESLRPADVVLVKASSMVGLSAVATALEETTFLSITTGVGWNMKIVVTGSMAFSAEQVRRLRRVGRVTRAGGASSAEEWLKQVEGADVVCSDGTFVAGNLGRLHDVFVTFPFVEIGSFDTEALASRNVMVANARGSNRDSVVEWAVFMALSLLRRFPDYVNADRELRFERGESLSGKDVCVIGAGDIGSRLGEVLATLGAKVRYVTRDDELMTAVKGGELIVNSLSCTPSSTQLLDRSFFRALEPGSYFITYVRPHTFDVKALLEALDDGILAGAAIDCDPQTPFDTANAYYRTLAAHEKVLATPHVAFATTQAERQSLDTVVKNVEAFANGRPRNVLVKR